MLNRCMRSARYLLVMLLVAARSSFAQSSVYRRPSVADTLNHELPSHWYVRDLAERQNIAAAGEAITDGLRKTDDVTHVSVLSVLSVVSMPEPIGAIIRVSILSIEETSQTAVNEEICLDRAARSI